MTKIINRLLRLKKWHLDEASKQMVTLNREEESLRKVLKAIDTYMGQELNLFDQALESHAIVPHFLRNISLKQAQVNLRLKELDQQKTILLEEVTALYREKKQVEKMQEMAEKKEAAAMARKDQAQLDENALQKVVRDKNLNVPDA